MKTNTLFLFMGLLLIGPAHAGLNADSCKADIQKHCPGIKPGGGAIAACLKKHESTLAPGCAQFMQEAGNAVKNFSRACGADVKKICTGVKPGEGRVLACLKKNESKVSVDCKQAMKSLAK